MNDGWTVDPVTGIVRQVPPPPPPPIHPKIEDAGSPPMIRPKIEDDAGSPQMIRPKIEDDSRSPKDEIEIPAAQFPPMRQPTAAKSGQPNAPAKPRPMRPPPLMQPPMMTAPPPLPTLEPPGPMEQAKIIRFQQNRNPTFENLQKIAYENLAPRAEPWKLRFVPKAPGCLGLQGPSQAWAMMGVSWAYRVAQNTPFCHHVWVESPAVTLRGSPRPGVGLLQPAPR